MNGARRLVLAFMVAAVVAPVVALAAKPIAQPTSASCEARPIVDRFVRAFNRGELAELDSLFAQETEGWSWYAVGDLAGRRSLAAAKNRLNLVAYFDQRHRMHESLRVVEFKENSGGNFEFALIRKADDLADGRPVRRLGKGRIICEAGTLGVWSLGGRPRPPWFGRCPTGALPLSEADLPAARAPVMWFVRNLLQEFGPELDIHGARAVRAELATRTVRGGYAKIKCGATTQRRTAVVFVQLPAMAPSASMSSAVFYTSRTAGGWVVWFQIH
jgi:hypothetical protein